MSLYEGNINPINLKMQELSDIISRSRESAQDYQTLKHLINQSSLSLAEKMTLISELDAKFSE